LGVNEAWRSLADNDIKPLSYHIVNGAVTILLTRVRGNDENA
jgi:hypothetical protein